MNNRAAQALRAWILSFPSFPRVSSWGGEVDRGRGNADPGLYLYPFTGCEGARPHLGLWQNIRHPAPSPGEKGEQIMASERSTLEPKEPLLEEQMMFPLAQGMIELTVHSSTTYLQNSTDDSCSALQIKHMPHPQCFPAPLSPTAPAGGCL